MARRRNKRDTDPKKVIGYIRVSTDEQALGPDAQRDALNAWSERHDARLLAIHEDIGISGASPLEKRPGLNDALDALVLEGAGVLLVAKRDRLARDVIVGADVERMAERAGARVLSADEVGNGEGPEHQLMRNLLMAFASYAKRRVMRSSRVAMST